MERAPVRKPVRRRWFLVRGESAVAVSGLALLAILVLTVGAAAAWVVYFNSLLETENRQQQANNLAASISLAAESMLSSNDLTPVRRLITEAGRTHDLTACRIKLPDGRVVADLDPLLISVATLPESWPAQTSTSVTETQFANGWAAVPMTIAGRGPAMLELAVRAPTTYSVRWEIPAGVGGVASVGLVALLLVYRRMRKRFRAVGAIGESLLIMEAGETSTSALSVNESLGSEASAWNRLLTQYSQNRASVLTQKAQASARQAGEHNNGLESACDAMWQGLMLVDKQLRITYANGAATVLLKAEREDIIGREVADVIGSKEVMEAIEAVAGGMLHRRSTIEVPQVGDSGRGVLRHSVRPVRQGDEASAMVVVEDVTQQRLAEEARNSFVAQATHELRTPLTNIRLYVESALEEGENDPALHAKCLNVINHESRRLERIVGDMLSVAEIEAGTLKLRRGDVRLETLFQELKDDFDAQAREKNVTLTFNLPPKFPVIQGDRDKIVLALHNVVGNAIKYTPNDGKVTVTAECERSRFVVDVADTGIGIGEEDAKKIFQKFYRAQDSRVSDITGSGLGLALAREVVRLHGGDITVRSELNQGSTFSLVLPMLAEAA